MRFRILILASTLVVALAFGLSFYFALVSNEAAVAKQVPELEIVANKLKSLLIINTLGFAAVIIGSLYLLSSLITSRMFYPIGRLQKKLLTIAGGKIPHVHDCDGCGPFGSLDDSLKEAVTAIREKEMRELDEISRLAETAAAGNTSGECRDIIEKIRGAKKVFMGMVDNGEDPRTCETQTEKLFMQPM